MSVATENAYGNVTVGYSYDAFGQLAGASESLGGTTAWTTPYRYDGRDGVRYDGETGLYWMSVRISTDRCSPLTIRSGDRLPPPYPAHSTHDPIPPQR